MIDITFHTADRELWGVDCKGHARYAPEGQDIVCSAVSTCLLGVANELHRYCNPDCTVQKGEINIWLRPNKETQILMEFAVNTLKSVEEQYPEYVKVNIE